MDDSNPNRRVSARGRAPLAIPWALKIGVRSTPCRADDPSVPCAERVEKAQHEGGEVVGGSAGDEVAVADAGGILPGAAGVLDVVADCEEAGDLSPLEALGRAEHPGAVADRGEDLPFLGGLRDEVHHRLVPPHVVGRVAAGDNDRVEIVGLDLIGGDVRLGRVAVLRGVRLARARADDLDVAARLAEPEDRVPELQVLVELLDEDGDALASQVIHGALLWGFERRPHGGWPGPMTERVALRRRERARAAGPRRGRTRPSPRSGPPRSSRGAGSRGPAAPWRSSNRGSGRGTCTAPC